MSIPFAYAIGLAVVLIARELFFVLPGSGSLGGALLGAPLLLVPALLSWLAIRRAHRLGGFDWWARLLARAAPASLPTSYVVMLVPCGYLDSIDALAGDSHGLSIVLLLLPLFVAEVTRLVVEARSASADEALAGAVQLRGRLAFVLVFTMPWIALGVLGDLLRGHRATYAFFVGSSAGLTLGALAFVLVMGVALPLVFRVLFGLRSDLPESIADELRSTAAALGFPGRAVLWLDSGLRHVNALLLGPMPWPRYLVLTDGLMAALDLHALRGVVAHEVGHAQAGHPALLLTLFVVTPLLAANVVQQFEPEHVGDLWTIGGGAVALLVGWWVLRRVAHRFEHEADVLSAIALGGAEPCISALQRVGQVVHNEPERASMLHPSESDRLNVLRRFAADPAYRARFTLRGVRLRHAIVAVVGIAALGAMWTWYENWQFEKAAQRFYVGDFAGAKQQVDLVGTNVPGSQWRWWDDFRQELDAAIAVAGDGGDWETVRPRLAAEGWRRGLEVLQREDPIVARPWFALATEDAERSPLRRSVLLYCQAARDHDTERMAVLRAHIAALGGPLELQQALAR